MLQLPRREAGELEEAEDGARDLLVRIRKAGERGLKEARFVMKTACKLQPDLVTKRRGRSLKTTEVAEDEDAAEVKASNVVVRIKEDDLIPPCPKAPHQVEREVPAEVGEAVKAVEADKGVADKMATSKKKQLMIESSSTE